MSQLQSKQRIQTTVLAFSLIGLMTLSGCSPEVGSEAWCQKLDETHKTDWSTRDAASYAKHCIFRRGKTR
jgi:hypothetical protein